MNQLDLVSYMTPIHRWICFMSSNMTPNHHDVNPLMNRRHLCHLLRNYCKMTPNILSGRPI